MTRCTTLSDDLAALAAEERSRLGELPSAEQLIAYRDGELPAEEAERLRDRLAVDPEWAAVYLDLKRGSEPESPSADRTDVADSRDIDDAWQRLAPKLVKRDAAVAAESRPGADAVVPFSRPGSRAQKWHRAPLALAATLILGLGLAWWLSDRGRPALPSGEYHVVEVTDATFRDARLAVPRNAVGIEFHIDAANFGVSGRLAVDLLDAANNVIRRADVDAAPGVVFRVASGDLTADRTYRLIVRPPGAPREDPALVDWTFIPIFDE